MGGEKRLEDHGIPGMTIMPTKATCKSIGKDGKDNSRTIDGFVMSRKLALWKHAGASLALEGHTAPHTAVKMQLMGINANPKVLVHERPRATDPTTTPKERIFDYDGQDRQGIDDLCKKAADIRQAAGNLTRAPTAIEEERFEQAFRDWYVLAGLEMNELFGQEFPPDYELKFKEKQLEELYNGHKGSRRSVANVMRYVHDRATEADRADGAAARCRRSKQEWGRWHTDHSDAHEDNQELCIQGRTIFEKWVNYAARTRQGEPPDHCLAEIMREAEEDKEQAIKVDKKLKRISWEEYVEEALNAKISKGHVLTKIREMEDVPKTIEESGFSTGI